MNEKIQFTKEELNILSCGLLALIDNAGKAIELTYDGESSKALSASMKKYQALNEKVCGMAEE